MTRQRDFQIFWVLILAAIFWTSIAEHDRLVQLYRKSPIPALLRHVPN